MKMRPHGTFELPEFRVSPSEAPASSTMTYEQAVQAFEEIISASRLREEPHPSPPLLRFEM